MSLQNQLAGGTINVARFVVADTAHDNRVVQASGTSVAIVGVSAHANDRNPDPSLDPTVALIAATVGRPIGVWVAGSCSVDLLVGAVGVTAGDLLTSDGSGQAVTATSGQWVGARATATTPAGQWCPVDVLSPTKA